MSRRNRSFFKTGSNKPRQTKSAQQTRFDPVVTATKRFQLDQLEKFAGDDSGEHTAQELRKVAQASATVDLGLQLRDELVHSVYRDRGVPMTGKTAEVDAAKLAMVPDTIEKLASLVGELQSAHAMTVQVVATLAGAVKLAQDGAIDIDDVFDFAREAILNGNVKLSTVDMVFDQDAGELIEAADSSSKHSAADEKSADPLTSYLRGVRGTR